MAYPAFPKQVYIDTSYLIKLLSYASDPANRGTKKCKDLYDHLLSSGVSLVASPLTLEESIFYLFFKRRLLAEATAEGCKSIKEFKRTRKKKYNSCYKGYSYIPHKILQESRALGITYDYPRYRTLGVNASKRVNQYAVKILRQYSQLDSKDAFHVAVARCLRIEYIISCDNDYKSVREITLYNPCE